MKRVQLFVSSNSFCILSVLVHHYPAAGQDFILFWKLCNLEKFWISNSTHEKYRGENRKFLGHNGMLVEKCLGQLEKRKLM